jgi:hypothetical protein
LGSSEGLLLDVVIAPDVGAAGGILQSQIDVGVVWVAREIHEHCIEFVFHVQNGSEPHDINALFVILFAQEVLADCGWQASVEAGCSGRLYFLLSFNYFQRGMRSNKCLNPFAEASFDTSSVWDLELSLQFFFLTQELLQLVSQSAHRFGLLFTNMHSRQRSVQKPQNSLWNDLLIFELLHEVHIRAREVAVILACLGLLHYGLLLHFDFCLYMFSLSPFL